MGLNPELSSYLAASLRIVLVACLLSTGILRYYGAIHRKGIFKYISFELVICSLVFVIWSLIDKYSLQYLMFIIDKSIGHGISILFNIFSDYVVESLIEIPRLLSRLMD